MRRCPRKYGETQHEFCTNTGTAPHIDGTIVLGPKQDLRCSVESRLDVDLSAPPIDACAPEVDQLHGGGSSSQFGHQVVFVELGVPVCECRKTVFIISIVDVATLIVLFVVADARSYHRTSPLSL